MALDVASQLISANMATTAEVRDFDSVVRLHWPRIYRFLLVSLRDRDLAETMTQDCFLKAYRARNAFRGESTIQTWLMQIAVNLVRDFAGNRRLQFWKRTQSATIDGNDISEWMPDT